MRCVACNRALSSQEATRKFSSGDFVDLCNSCLSTIKTEVDTIEGKQEDPFDDSDTTEEYIPEDDYDDEDN